MNKEEAMKILKDFHDKSALFSVRIALDTIIPELKESEDEKIRKELVKHCRNTRCVTEEGAERIAKWISWLEKQGEQKPADKVEPKFKVGDWIIDNKNRVGIIVRILDEHYIVSFDGRKVQIPFEWEGKLFRKWTIEDARPGDVLTCNEEILLFKSYSVQGRISLYCWYNGQTNNFHSKEVNYTLLTTRNKIHPATKEQCDTLFAKMKEAGYEWLKETKELKKIEQKSAEWSEEDEGIFDEIVGDIKALELNTNSENLSAMYKKEISWLKSLKDRYTWKPSDEQIEILNMVLTNESMDDNIARILRELREQLKKLMKM